MAVYQKLIVTNQQFVGLSTDAKPTNNDTASNVNPGDIFYETDTQFAWKWSGTAWVRYFDATISWAYKPSALSYVPLQVDASNNLYTTGGGGGGGGSVTQGTVPWVVSGAAGAALATEATLAKVPGLAIPIFDATQLTQTSVTDVWTFYTGGIGGTLVATVTITYTDTTKATISTVVKT